MAAQNFSVSSIGTANLGPVVAAATGPTTFRASASTGTVTRLSGNGLRSGTAPVRSLVTISCANQPSCNTDEAAVTVALTGTPTGRAGALQNFTVSTSAATATITLAPGTGSSISFRIGPVGRNGSKTFWLGYDLPINGDNGAGASGAASSSFVVTVSRLNGSRPISLSGSVNATVLRSLTLSKTQDLSFGRVSAPKTGAGTITLAPATDAVTVSGIGVASLSAPLPRAAAFTVSGEGGQSVSLSVPSTVTLTGPDGSLTVTTIPTHNGAQVLSGSLGAAGTIPLKVGGSLPLSSSTTTGTYTGTLSVTVQYN
ncbi:DUF4402 domain-containing protein [Novosphingobium sp. TH158]|uniref:DUF4402 domain-containing protein n=1 Tax=Novosphingobium sp. TH158 TaxID=2067455 RepID=UPI0013045D49|nr:DUF4402 domain-containing protein [Novosphingobium sp. TH158]